MAVSKEVVKYLEKKHIDETQNEEELEKITNLITSKNEKQESLEIEYFHSTCFKTYSKEFKLKLKNLN